MSTEQPFKTPHGAPLRVMDDSPPRPPAFQVSRVSVTVTLTSPKRNAQNKSKQHKPQTATYLLPSLAFPQLETQLRISEAQPNLTSDHLPPSSQSANTAVS
jgi:hypothetical protein